MRFKIPVSQPAIGSDDVGFVSKVLADLQVSGRAPIVKEFESNFSKYMGINNSISSCNGTAALHLAVKSLELDEGDEVIIPAFTMMSPIFALLYEKIRPVLVDVDPKYWILVPGELERRITSKTKAILVVHTYGNVAAMDEIVEIAAKHNLAIIEDCAESLGATYKGRKAGTFGQIAIFSFFANKLITTGEGGMVCTNSGELAEKINSYHDLCFGKTNKFLHENVGYNYRLSALQAALGVSQLRKIDEHLAKIRNIARVYRRELLGNGPFAVHEEPPYVSGSYWMYSVVLNREIPRDVVTQSLSSAGIETRPFFVPAHKQPACRDLFSSEVYPSAERIATSGINLPSGLYLTDEDVTLVASSLLRAVRDASHELV